MSRIKKKKICFIITSEIHYARNQLILAELKQRSGVELQIVVGGSAVLPMYGDVLPLLERDGLGLSAKVVMNIEGGTPLAMAKTAGIGVGEFASVFEMLKPDIVVVRGDRYEVLSAAVAAAYLNVPVAHIEGGDVTGTIDESVRHAITKLSHLHFVTNRIAKKRVLRMGENPQFVFDVGAPEIEFIARCKKIFTVNNKLINYLGVGHAVDIVQPFIIVMHHPVTTEYGKNRKNTEILLTTIHEAGIPAVWFWPNADAGTDEVSKSIRVFRECNARSLIRFIKYLPPNNFYGLLLKAKCLVGNSSSGIKECSYLGIPAVNIGSRQNGRFCGDNVRHARYEKDDIKKAIHAQIMHGRYAADTLYYKRNTSARIAQILSTCHPVLQKKFFD